MGTIPGWVGSVQLQLQLLTATEPGKTLVQNIIAKCPLYIKLEKSGAQLVF